MEDSPIIIIAIIAAIVGAIAAVVIVLFLLGLFGFPVVILADALSQLSSAIAF